MKTHFQFLFILLTIPVITFGQDFIMEKNAKIIVQSCTGKIYDNGGPDSSYTHDSRDTIIIYPGEVDKYIRLKMDSIDMETWIDVIRVFDGPNTENEISISNSYFKSVFSSHPTGALTLIFNSYWYSNKGFEISIDCLDSIPGEDVELKYLSGTTDTCIAGNGIFSYYNLCNNGKDYLEKVDCGLFLSNDSIFDDQDKLIGSREEGYIEGFISYDFFINGTLPINIDTSGNYYIIIKSDYNNLIDEEDENNNDDFFKIYIKKAEVDLRVVSNFQAYYYRTNNESNFLLNNSYNRWSFNVSNNGNTSTPETDYGFYLSSDTIFDTNDICIYTGDIGPISIASINQYSSYPYIPYGYNIDEGIYYLLLVLDHENKITETDETNNILKSQVAVINEKQFVNLKDVLLESNYIAKNNYLTIDIQVQSNFFNNTYTCI